MLPSSSSIPSTQRGALRSVVIAICTARKIGLQNQLPEASQAACKSLLAVASASAAGLTVFSDPQKPHQTP